MSAPARQTADLLFPTTPPDAICPTERIALGWGIAAAVAIHIGAWALLERADVRLEPTEPPRPIRVSLVEPPPAVRAPTLEIPRPAAPTPPQSRPRLLPPAQSPVSPSPSVSAMTAKAAEAAAAPATSVPAAAEPMPSAGVAEPTPAQSPQASASAPTLPRQAASAAAPATEPRFDAAYLNNPAPPYPGVSRRLGEHGRVLLRVQVDERGVPTNVSLRASSGYERLDSVAVETVRRWKFVPARRGDEAVGAWVLVPIVFNLRS